MGGLHLRMEVAFRKYSSVKLEITQVLNHPAETQTQEGMIVTLLQCPNKSGNPRFELSQQGLSDLVTAIAFDPFDIRMTSHIRP